MLGWALIVQGRTITTARLPGAGNLLCQAGEDVILSEVPDRASHVFQSRTKLQTGAGTV